MKIRWEKLQNGGAVAQYGKTLVDISPDDDDGYHVYVGGRFAGERGTLPAAKKLAIGALVGLVPRKNPLTPRAKLAKALTLRAKFRATAGTRKDAKPRIRSAKVRTDNVQVGIGKALAIEYTLVDENGKLIKGQSFRHEFSGKSAPLLTASHDGNQLYFVGGKYRFKTDGINDLQ